MSTQHSPGPWQIDLEWLPTDFPDWRSIYLVNKPDCVMSVSGHIGEANARLIAAAPELLALAKQYASECARCGGSAEIIVNESGDDDPINEEARPCNECEDIRAVISKAEGK